ncbi:precorrin-4 C(11)-methyltransferase [Patulibacter brassicae]|jgi:precorrin-4 C11-methyltransferase|uniref:Precorrin-4 C(11)-methyltransferase n=1 Tax=Patulibacter brassicae TaxID=1705717 RepID=A0ABU4VID9_9ACTN|nr:precorrin-4 C(11)-methyltransferase [Patulibacter brassicae]MDX8151538.1 precorrin-4 C(11)-methyltransferase [Patulibacter brassicae]
MTDPDRPTAVDPRPAAGGRVVFVGAGPGAADLLTIRGAKVLGEADVVVWPRSLVPPEVMEHARPDAEVLTSDDHTLEDVIALFSRAKVEGLVVCRLQSGDPSIYATLHEQINACRRMDLPYEIVPGVGSLSALAAALGQELTVPEVAQSLVLTRRAVRVPMPENEQLQDLARHGTTMALYLSVRRPRELQADLLAGGYAPDAPVAIGYRVSWPDERIIRCRLDELAATLKAERITTQALIVLGPALAGGEEERRSHVYRPTYGHRYRRLGNPAAYRGDEPS